MMGSLSARSSSLNFVSSSLWINTETSRTRQNSLSTTDATVVHGTSYHERPAAKLNKSLRSMGRCACDTSIKRTSSHIWDVMAGSAIAARVCKAWKALLGPWPRTLVIDELPQQEKSQYNWSGSREQILKDACIKCQVLIIDLSRPYSAPSHAKFHKDFEAIKTFRVHNLATPKAIVKSKTLQHVILYGGRMCLQLFADWHAHIDGYPDEKGTLEDFTHKLQLNWSTQPACRLSTKLRPDIRCSRGTSGKP